MKRCTGTLFLLFVLALPVRAQIVFNESDFTSRFGTMADRSEFVVTQATLEANRATLEGLRDLTGDNRTWDFTPVSWEDGGTGSVEYISPPTGLPGADDPRASGATFAIYFLLNRPDGVTQETWTYHGLTSTEVTNYGAFARAQGFDDISFFDTPILGIPLPLTAGTTWGPVSTTRLTEVPGIGSVTTTETYTGTVDGWGTLVTPAGSADCLRYDQTIEISFNVGGIPVTTTTHALTFITKDGQVAASIGLDGDRNVLSASYSSETATGGGGSAPAAAPTAVAPADGATDQPTALDLSWTSVTDATTYAVDVATDAGFTALVDQQTGLGAPQASVSGLAEGTTYYWRARGENTFGAGPWSNVYSFTTSVSAPAAVALASPDDGATDVETMPTLSWNAADGAASYHLQVATDDAFTTVVADLPGLTDTQAAVGPLAEGTTHYWRVRAANAGGAGPWSNVYSFTTSVSAPAAVALASPDDGATDVETMPTLSWNAADGAASYHLQVATDDAFTTVVADLPGLTDTQATVGPLAPGTMHYWRVRAANAGGDGPWSPTRSFTTAANVAVEAVDAGLPSAFALYPNYPNPFNPTTTLRFDLPEAAAVTLAVYDVLGRRVSTLVQGTLAAGRYRYAWEAGDLPGGLYLYRLETPRFRETGTMILLK